MNLVSNIGFGADATHTKMTSHLQANVPTKPMEFPLVHPPVVARDVAADEFTEDSVYGGVMKRMFDGLRGRAKVTRGMASRPVVLHVIPQLIEGGAARALAQRVLKNAAPPSSAFAHQVVSLLPPSPHAQELAVKAGMEVLTAWGARFAPGISGKRGYSSDSLLEPPCALRVYARGLTPGVDRWSHTFLADHRLKLLRPSSQVRGFLLDQ